MDLEQLRVIAATQCTLLDADLAILELPSMRCEVDYLVESSEVMTATMAITNDSPEAVTAEFVRPLVWRIATNGDPTRYRGLVHGLHSFSGSGSFDFTEAPPKIPIPFVRASSYSAWVPPSGQAGTLVSAMYTTLVVLDSDGNVDQQLTVGSADPRTHLTQFVMTWHGDHLELAVQVQLEGIPIAPGASLQLPKIMMSTEVPHLAQRRWVDAVAGVTGAPTGRTVPDGYCSWYRHYTNISHAQLGEDMRAVRSTFGDGFDLFHVDDGYQRNVGDWLQWDPSFPQGIAPVVTEARELGWSAGIWVAPLFALHDSDLVRQHPDWVLRSPGGKPTVGMYNVLWDKRRPVQVLDATHPGVISYLHEVFSQFRSMGIGFFKLDFLYAGLLKGVRHDSSLTTLQGLRALLMSLRSAVGDEAVLLGCGCPMEAGVGLVDACRSSSDVTPGWRERGVTRLIGKDFETLGTNVAHRNVLVRAVQHRAWFENDPDCLFAYWDRNRLTSAEERLLWHTNAVAGGPLMFATQASELTQHHIDMVDRARTLNRAVKHGATRWWSPDVMTNGSPEILVAQGETEAWCAVANLRDVAGDRTIDVAALLGWTADEMSVTVIDAANPSQVVVEAGVVRVFGLDAHDSVCIHIELAIGSS